MNTEELGANIGGAFFQSGKPSGVTRMGSM
jgi:hypothetical protein